MEKRINEKKNKKKFDLKNIIESYKKFYVENLKKKHVVIFFIMLVIFFVMLSYFLTNSAYIKNEIANEQISQKAFFEELFKEKIPLLAVIIFAGITPFFFLSIIGALGSYTLAFEVCYTYFINGSKLSIILGSIGSIIEMIGISLAVATGIYYCIQSTKKFRYSQHMSFGMKDVKRTIYEIRKNEKKLKELYEKEQKKANQREKLNVKIPYVNLGISFFVSVIILCIGTIISNII